ncbi:uncharacterized protein LOC115821779 [Chanos chanos]|uniref:Uncharacterized protein LOC115821779 n=1 Tax=Chanos chanos TaxID=29144 RepID=A0A6J2WDH9_CHACN|nr:uncharacterized protein LOC115821779 [Chanos chanos]
MGKDQPLWAGAVVASSTSWSPAFIQELLPAAKKTSLLYHQSYLCLAKFPELERLIRSRAVETQLLFASSEAVLLKCVCTSDNLVQSLFPILKVAVQKDKSDIAVKYLDKARKWIKEIIDDVDELVKKYDEHNKAVAKTTSDIDTKKTETDQKIKNQTKEMNDLEAHLKKCQDDLTLNANRQCSVQNEYDNTNSNLESVVRSAASRNKGLAFLMSVVPFFGAIIGAIRERKAYEKDMAKIRVLENDLNRLSSEKSTLKQEAWRIQANMADIQMKLAMAKVELGTVPSTDHLEDVKCCLSRIQEILVQLQKFWKKVDVILKYLQEKTFVAEDLIDVLPEFKTEFLHSITVAEQVWKVFGQNCHKVNGIFSVQSKDAYKFLESSPSALSKEEWQIQYTAVKKRMEQIYSSQSAIEESSAITQ